MTSEEEVNSSTEPDKPFRFAINPVVQEANARRLVDIMAQCFPESGGICEDLRRKFEEITGLKRQSFYDTLAYCKFRQWITGGAKDRREKYQLYSLNPDGCWREPISTGEVVGEPLSSDQLQYLVDSKTRQIDELQDKVERLLDWSSSSDTNGVNVALSSLMKIVGDGSASTRQRIKASAAILNYRTQQSDIAEFVKKYLQSVCESTDNVDYRIEAGELLRRHEAPRVTPDSVRPAYRDDSAEPAEPPIPLMELVRQRKERSDRFWRDKGGNGSSTQHARDTENKDIE